MAEILRICNPFEFKYLYEWDGSKFTGYFSWFAEGIRRAITNASNVTVEIRSQNDQPGERINSSSDQFSGCIGRLQSNQSDAMLFLTEYPSEASNISQGLVMSDSVIQFMSVYYPEESRVNLAQVEKSLNTFDTTVWFISALSMVTSIALLLLQALIKMHRRRVFGKMKPVQFKHIPLETMAHMTNHGALSNTNGSVRKTMFIVLSLFSFLVIFYVCSYFQTDLVIIPPPLTMRSYKQLLNKKCGVYFIGGGDTYQPFKFAPTGTDERKLWDFSVNKFPEDLVLFKYTGPDSMARMTNAFYDRKLALITDSAWAPYHLRSQCTYLLNHHKLNAYRNAVNITMRASMPLPLTSQDEHARVSLKGFISSSLPSAPLKRLKKVLRRVFESGMHHVIMKFVHDVDVTDFLDTTEKGYQSVGNMTKCMASQLILPEYSVTSLDVGNFKNFPVYALYLVFINFVVLMIEHQVAKNSRAGQFKEAIIRQHSLNLSCNVKVE